MVSGDIEKYEKDRGFRETNRPRRYPMIDKHHTILTSGHDYSENIHQSCVITYSDACLNKSKYCQWEFGLEFPI